MTHRAITIRIVLPHTHEKKRIGEIGRFLGTKKKRKRKSKSNTD